MKDIKEIVRLHQLCFLLRYKERWQRSIQATGGGDFVFICIIKTVLTGYSWMPDVVATVRNLNFRATGSLLAFSRDCNLAAEDRAVVSVLLSHWRDVIFWGVNFNVVQCHINTKCFLFHGENITPELWLGCVAFWILQIRCSIFDLCYTVIWVFQDHCVLCSVEIHLQPYLRPSCVRQDHWQKFSVFLKPCVWSEIRNDRWI